MEREWKLESSTFAERVQPYVRAPFRRFLSFVGTDVYMDMRSALFEGLDPAHLTAL